MTYKTILTQVFNGPGGDAAVNTARDVAKIFSAHVVGVGAMAFNPPMAPPFAYMDGAVIQALREDLDKNLQSAKARFLAATDAVVAGATWIQEVDTPLAVMGANAAGADLVVASRPAQAEAREAAAPVEDLVMEMGLPVLAAPGGDVVFSLSRIVVAWKNARETRQALVGALPMLKMADRVFLVSIQEHADDEADLSLKEVAVKLARHGVTAEAQVVAHRHGAPQVAQRLEAAADEIGADLIVAGAYGHSRLREWTFGGVTKTLLSNSSRHVLFGR
jgi:nucleotide-binding universal stress UspA family protein